MLMRKFHGVIIIFSWPCHSDILQWAILAIRNLCEDNPANQQLIAQLETQGIAEAASQLEFGCEVEIGADGRLKLKP